MCKKYSQDSQELLHREYISRRKLVFAIYLDVISKQVWIKRGCEKWSLLTSLLPENREIKLSRIKVDLQYSRLVMLQQTSP